MKYAQQNWEFSHLSSRGWSMCSIALMQGDIFNYYAGETLETWWLLLCESFTSDSLNIFAWCVATASPGYHSSIFKPVGLWGALDQLQTSHSCLHLCAHKDETVFSSTCHSMANKHEALLWSKNSSFCLCVHLLFKVIIKRLPATWSAQLLLTESRALLLEDYETEKCCSVLRLRDALAMAVLVFHGTMSGQAASCFSLLQCMCVCATHVKCGNIAQNTYLHYRTFVGNQS